MPARFGGFTYLGAPHVDSKSDHQILVSINSRNLLRNFGAPIVVENGVSIVFSLNMSLLLIREN